jgi:hypothetical protein
MPKPIEGDVEPAEASKKINEAQLYHLGPSGRSEP